MRIRYFAFILLCAASVQAQIFAPTRTSGFLTNESDTLSTVLSRGNNAAGLSITNFRNLWSTNSSVIIAMKGFTNTAALPDGALFMGEVLRQPSSTGSVVYSANPANSDGVGIHGLIEGTMELGANVCGSQFRGRIRPDARVYFNNDWGAQTYGYIDSGNYASNLGAGAVQILYLAESNENALTTTAGDGSLLMGAGVASNEYAVVVGNGQVSHGDGSITAGGGFYGDGSGLTNLNAASTTMVNYAAAPACYQVTLTNTSAMAYTNNWNPTQSVSKITATSTGTVTFVMNWPAAQKAYWDFCYDATGMPATVFPAGAIYFTSGVFSNTAPALGSSNFISVLHNCATYQIMVFTNTIGTWGTP